MKQPATRESDNLRYFGSINGREYYIGKEEVQPFIAHEILISSILPGV